MQQVYIPVRSFSHGEAGCVTQFDLAPAGAVCDRGQLLAEIEFLASHAGADRCTCVVTCARASLALLARLFPQVRFCAYSPDEEYDPSSSGLRPAAFAGSGNVSHEPSELSKPGMLLLAAGRTPEHGRLLLISCGDSSERMLLLHSLLAPDASLFRLEELPADFLSGRMVFPVHSPARARLCYLEAQRGAHCRACYPAVWEEELAYFQMVLRVPGTGKYDREAEHAILQGYAWAVLGASNEQAWGAVEQIRALLPPLA